MTSDTNVTTLILALRTNDRRVHTLVVDDLVLIGQGAVPTLLAALDDECATVRAGAARALGKIGDQTALAALVFCLQHDDDVEVRKSAVWALHMGGAASVSPLIEALADTDEWVRFGAVIVLAKIGEPAVQPLIVRLQSENALVRAYVAETLGRIGDLRAAEPLVQVLDDNDSEVWQQAAIALGRMRDARAVWPLVSIVRDAGSSLQTKAIKALGIIRDVRAVEPLIDVIYDEDDRWMRLFALEALGQIGDIRGIEALLDAAYDQSRDVRTKAIVTLSEIESHLATDALYSIYEDMDVDVEDQQTALFELGKRGDERAVSGLIDLLQYDPQIDNRIYAALVLGDIGSAEAVDSLVDALCGDVSDVAEHALKSLVKMARTATDLLVRNLHETHDAERRRWLVKALGEIGNERAVNALRDVVADAAEIWWVRDAAQEMLIRLGHHPKRML